MPIGIRSIGIALVAIATVFVFVVTPSLAQETPTGTVRAFGIDCGAESEASLRVGTTDSIEGCEPVATTLTFYRYGDDFTTKLDTDATGLGLINLPEGTYTVVAEATQLKTDIDVVAGEETPLVLNVPSRSPAPTEAPEQPAETPVTTSPPVTTLPSTGSGQDAGTPAGLLLAAAGILLATAAGLGRVGSLRRR